MRHKNKAASFSVFSGCLIFRLGNIMYFMNVVFYGSPLTLREIANKALQRTSC